jgi:hypothetical protein
VIERILARLTINAAVIALLVVALAVQTVRIEGFKFWPISHKGLKAELADAKAELKAISSKKDEQRKVTQGKIVETRVVFRDADKVAERIEKAPTQPECKTPPGVMSADL